MTGKEFSSKRKALKLSQEGLGDLIGFKRRTVQDWEAMPVVPKYASLLIDYLLIDIDSKKGKQEPTVDDDLTNQLFERLQEKDKYINSLEDRLEYLKSRLEQFDGKSKTG